MDFNFEVEGITHKKEKRLKVIFDFDTEKNLYLKSIAGARWSSTLKAWHVPDNNETRQLFRLKPLEDDSWSPEKLLQIEQFIKFLKSKRYSENTIKTYTDALKVFIHFFKHKQIAEISNADLITFNNDYIIKKQYSASYQNQVVNAIKLFFKTTEQKILDPTLVHRPRQEHTLPNVLSKEEVKLILEAHHNIKHKIMLSLLYACGLRCGELLALKPEHVDSKREVLIIKQSKGKKDRIVPLSLKIIDVLRQYYQIYKPKTYLFEGQTEGSPYSNRSLQLILKQALEKTGINKPVTLHWLRHSYATHLLEAGTNLRYIQEILGHKSSKTTEIYTHVSTHNIQNIKSPFDTL